MRSRWFYFAQQDVINGIPTVATWRGTNELLRWSSVVLRQRRFTLGPIRFFYGRTEVDLELIWHWHPSVDPMLGRSDLVPA